MEKKISVKSVNSHFIKPCHRECKREETHSRENGNRKGDRRQHSESCNGEIEGDEYGGNRKGDCQQNDAVRIQFI